MFTFTFKLAKDREYSFNVVSESDKDALLILRADLATVIQEINEVAKTKE